MTTACATPKSTFRHGVHPNDRKGATAPRSIELKPFVEEYVLPLAQNLGKPPKPIVRVGQTVCRGEVIAVPDGFVSTALHAPVSGTVIGIEHRSHPTGQKLPAVVVRADPFSTQRDIDCLPRFNKTMPLAARLRLIQEAGLVGLGGAAFPTHVKLSIPEGKRIRFAILNGCECEPYLTCDHHVMVEHTAQAIRGLQVIMDLLGVERSYIGVEVNKPDAIAALKDAAAGLNVEIVPLEVKYPQGAEKFLIDAVLHREVPSGKLPLDLEVVVQNVGTAVALAQLADFGRPLIDRVVTVSGPGIERPANVRVPIGTPVRAVIEHCGGLRPGVKQLVLGGPLMGLAQKTLDVPVTKGTSGILAFMDVTGQLTEQPCLRCGRCLEACPMFLNPSMLSRLVRQENHEALQQYHLMDCLECAGCSYVCPSHIPLVQLLRMGKALVRQKSSRP